ncbi:hypothetical protein BJV77DRAFT_987657 [Russula vinacea]|nr:hypothetical protein BJV77DRAFT_987657 [Russula vinacea]
MYRENPRIMYNSSEVLMTPYLHFIGGDHLYLGASITLLIFALLERLLHATRGAMDARWRRSSTSLLAQRSRLNATLPAGDGASLWRKKEKRDESAQVEVIGSTKVSHVQGSRTLPPFVLSRDAARGALYSLQASLDYALMLAVM